MADFLIFAAHVIANGVYLLHTVAGYQLSRKAGDALGPLCHLLCHPVIPVPENNHGKQGNNHYCGKKKARNDFRIAVLTFHQMYNSEKSAQKQQRQQNCRPPHEGGNNPEAHGQRILCLIDDFSDSCLFCRSRHNSIAVCGQKLFPHIQRVKNRIRADLFCGRNLCVFIGIVGHHKAYLLPFPDPVDGPLSNIRTVKPPVFSVRQVPGNPMPFLSFYRVDSFKISALIPGIDLTRLSQIRKTLIYRIYGKIHEKVLRILIGEKLVFPLL